jgi:hypothetical protein
MVVMKKHISFVVSALICFSVFCFDFDGALYAKAENEKQVGQSIEINSESISGIIEKLTSEEFQGRGTGQAGMTKARNFLVEKIREMGLKPLPGLEMSGTASFLQPVPLMELEPDNEKSSINIEGLKGALRCGSGFLVKPIAPGNLRVSGELVFAGYGIEAPEFGYNDYASLDVKDKIIVLLDGEPATEDYRIFRGRSSSYHSDWRRKLSLAKTKGAAAVIVVSSKPSQRGDLFSRMKRREKSRKLPFVIINEAGKIDFTLIVLSNEARDKVFNKAGRSALSIQQEIDKSCKPVTFSFGTSADINIEYTLARAFTEYNILAFIPGVDPRLKDEFIITGAHYDHHGIMADGTIYPGADDNASGVTGNLTAMEALVKSGIKFKRSIILALWTAEEKGLLGSFYFRKHPPVAYEKIVTYLNSDMIGRNHMNKPENSDFLMIFHSTQSPALSPVLNGNSRKAGLKPRVIKSETMGGGSGGSDHMNFHEEHIPSVFFFTGIHNDYEKPGDTPDKLNMEKLARISLLIALTAAELANSDNPPEFDPSIKDDPGKKRGRPF